MNLHEAGAALAVEAKRFASFGWMRGTSGNLSVVLDREPLQLAVTASGLDKGELTSADVVRVDADGSPVDGGKPSAEALLHARIAAATGAGAIFHVHTVAAVALSQERERITFSDLEMLKGIGVPAHDVEVSLPVVANSQDMTELWERVAAARDPQMPGVVVAAHGIYAWGADVRETRRHVEIIQWLLELELARSRPA